MTHSGCTSMAPGDCHSLFKVREREVFTKHLLRAKLLIGSISKSTQESSEFAVPILHSRSASSGPHRFSGTCRHQFNNCICPFSQHPGTDFNSRRSPGSFYIFMCFPMAFYFPSVIFLLFLLLKNILLERDEPNQ